MVVTSSSVFDSHSCVTPLNKLHDFLLCPTFSQPLNATEKPMHHRRFSRNSSDLLPEFDQVVAASGDEALDVVWLLS